jgi:Fur family peroxide stress response transcriptional regulator
MVDTEVRVEQMLSRLRGHGCRITPQRVALLRLLAADEGHSSASHLYEQLKAQFPTTSLATVYKTLNLLKEMGEVVEIGFSDDDNRYDGARPYPHPHLICVQCRKIVDTDNALAASLVENVAADSGYQIVGHRFDLYGLCPECQGDGSA